MALLVVISSGRATAATVTWDGGCGANTAWSCAANWSGDAVPGPADVASFDRASKSSSIVDGAFGGTVASVRMSTGYTGTLSLSRSLTVANALSQQSGTFAAHGQALALKTATISGGRFEASSSVTSIDGSLKIAGPPVFDANGGTIDFGGVSGTLSCNGVTFAQVVFTHATGTKTVGPNCTLPLGGNPTAGSGGSIKLKGTLAGSGTLTTTGKLTLEAGSGLAGFSGLVSGSLIEAGTHDFAAYAPFSVAKEFTVNPGAAFTAPTGAAAIAGNFTIKPGAAFDADGGTVVFDGTAGAKISCAGQLFNLVRFAQTAGRKIVGADCSLPLGNDPSLGAVDGSVTLNGALSGSGTLAAPQRLILNGAATLSGFGGLAAASSLNLNGVVANFGSLTQFEVAGAYTQTGGTVSVPAGASFEGPFALGPGSTFNAPITGPVSFADRFSVSASATFDSFSSTTVFDGTANATIACGPASFHLVAFEHTAGAKTVASSCSLPLGKDPNAAAGGSIFVDGALSGSGTLTASGTLTLEAGGDLAGFTGLAAENLTVNAAYDFGSYGSFDLGGSLAIGAAGSFVAPAGTASIAGDFLNGGSFVNNGGTVVLDGGDQALTGTTSFHGLTKTAVGSASLTFAAGSTTTVGGKLTMNGGSFVKPLKLGSSATGKTWRIDPEGEVEVSFLSVGDSTNLGPQIVAGESFNRGGNSGWTISGPAAALALEAQTTTPTAGATDNLTIVAKDAFGNTATSYTGSHLLTFGPVANSPSGAHATVANSSGTAVNLGSSTAISFSEGIATASGGKNGIATLVKAGSTSLTVTDGTISNGSGLAVTVSPGSASRIAWTHATVSVGALSSICLFTCTGTELGGKGTFKANVSITDGSGNTVSNLGAGKTVSVTAASGTITGGTLTIAASGPAESTTQFTYASSKGGAVTLTAASASGTVYTSATATMSR